MFTLPQRVRDDLHLDEPGAQLTLERRDDGSCILAGALPVPADQQWFWTNRWQQMERKADEDLAAGRVATFDDGDPFLADLGE